MTVRLWNDHSKTGFDRFMMQLHSQHSSSSAPELPMSPGMSDRLINRLLVWASVVAMLSAVVLVLGHSYPTSLVVDLLSAGVFAAARLLHQRLSVSQRLLALVLGGLVIAGAAMLSNPYARDAYLVVAAVMVLGFTHWTGWRAWILPVVLVAILLVVSTAIMMGQLHIDFNAVRAQSAPESWIIVTMTVALLSAAMGGAILELRSRLGAQIDQLEASHDKLYASAYSDELTGCANQKLLEWEVNSTLDADQGGTLLVVQVQGFSQLTALRGHRKVDQLLRQLGELLRERFEPVGVVAKLQTMQFAVWVHSPGFDNVEQRFAELESLARSRLMLDQLGITLVGAWTVAPTDGRDFSNLLQNAQVALGGLRGSASGSCCGFNPTMQAQLTAAHVLKSTVRAALDKEAFHAVYQSKVDRRSGAIMAFEGLARITVTSGETAPGPATFVPVLHAEGWMNEFGLLMLRTIVRDIPALQRRFGAHIKVAANISPPLFLSADFVSSLATTLTDANVAPQGVIVEITEEVFAGDLARVVEVTHALHELGVQVSLDDFGSGFSSLSYLRTVHFDEIKVDKSFTQDIETDERSRLLLSALCTLGQDLRCHVVLEGVETASQLACLQDMPIDCIQGFYFSRPQTLLQLLA